MNKNRIAFLIALTCSIMLSGCSAYTEYVPIELVVERGEHRLVENPALRTPAHIEAMKRILDGYGKPYKIRNDRLYIKASLQEDRDLLQNFTAKALAEGP
jgi:hypothetical protein